MKTFVEKNIDLMDVTAEVCHESRPWSNPSACANMYRMDVTALVCQELMFSLKSRQTLANSQSMFVTLEVSQHLGGAASAKPSRVQPPSSKPPRSSHFSLLRYRYSNSSSTWAPAAPAQSIFAAQNMLASVASNTP